jgi:hypothetical protein
MGFRWCSRGPFFLIPIRSSPLLAPSLAIAMTIAAPSYNGASTFSRPVAPRPMQRPTSALELIRTADRAQVPPAATHESATAPQDHPAQPSGFSPEQLAALAAPLDRANVRQREQGRGKVAYLEGLAVPLPSPRPRSKAAPRPRPRLHRHQLRTRPARWPSMPRRSRSFTAPCELSPGPF